MSIFINNNWAQQYPNMLKSRVRPGIATYSDFLEGLDKTTLSLTILNYCTTNSHPHCNINLPEPLAIISLTIADDILYIAGYNTSDERSNKAYKIAADKVTSSVAQPPTSSQT